MSVASSLSVVRHLLRYSRRRAERKSSATAARRTAGATVVMTCHDPLAKPAMTCQNPRGLGSEHFSEKAAGATLEATSKDVPSLQFPSAALTVSGYRNPVNERLYVPSASVVELLSRAL